MSMQTPSVGVLDITNATLRVGKLEVSSTQGIDSALNVFKANSILLFDNQRTSTTNPFTLSGSAIRNVGDFDSTSNIHLTSGSIYTGLGLPNAWSLEFDLYAPPSVDSGNVEVEFYSTASTGGGGYKVTFNTDDDSNQVILSYAGTSLTSQTAVIVESSGFRKVVIIYERGQISVSIGGTRVLHYKDIERPGPYTVGSAGFFRFAAPGAAVRRVRNIKISNDGPWSYTPNGGIAFLNGQVGIGTNSPTSNLEVAGSVKSRTMVVTGDSTFEDVVVSGNLTVSGTTTTVDTQNIQVTDPIIELGKDNDGSPVVDLGIVMTRPESNVAIIYDESAKSLEIGYTLNGASDSTITMDTANVFDMNVHGNVTMSGTLTLGEFAVVPSYGLDHVTGENNSTSDTIVSTNTVTGFQASSNIVVGRDALISGNVVVSSNLEVGRDALISGNAAVSSNLEVGTSNLFVDTQTGRVGVGTDAPAYDLDVRGTANVSDLTVTSNVNLLHTANTSSLKVNSNVVTEFPRSKKLIKYPRVALTADAQLSVGGYKGYIVNQSSFYEGSTAYAWLAFGGYQHWLSSGTAFDGGDDVFNNTNGPWISIQLPAKIKLEYLEFYIGSGRPGQTVAGGSVYASNDGSNWTNIGSLDNLGNYTDTAPAHVKFTHTTRYDRYLLHVTSVSLYTYAHIERLSLFGIPEYDPEADGVDVKVKSIPNVPNTDWLEVYYDAKDLADGTTTVNDLKPVGTAVNGTVAGNTSVTDGAFTFDGSGDYIESQNITTLSGNQVMSSSVWVKFNSWINANVDMVFSLGDRTGGNGKEYALAAYHSGTAASTNGLYVSIYGYNAITSKVIPDLNKWYHFVTTHDGSNHQIFINGVLVTSSVSNGDVSLPTSGCDLVLGGDTSSTRAQFMNGSIANFRLFNRALSQDEVWQLYAYQKEYFGHGDLSMTLKAGRLGIGTLEPRAALDVRGDMYLNGIFLRMFDGSSPDKAAISAKYIQEMFNRTTDGAYWINIPSIGPRQIFCIMNPSVNGGGWMMTLKGTRGSTFNYSASYWTTDNVLNETDATRDDADAKYETYNKYTASEWLAVFPDTGVAGGDVPGGYAGGWTWHEQNPVGLPMTLLHFYTNINEQYIKYIITGATVDSIREYSRGQISPFNIKKFNSSLITVQYGYNGATTGMLLYAVNYKNGTSATKWGFSGNNETDQATNDSSFGIGMNRLSYSAGDINGCCPATTGLDRSMRFEWYIR